jgi:hypothetical protein
MEEMERDPREVLALVVAKAMEAKWSLCEENGGITDAPPLLIGEFPNGDGFIAPDLMDGHPTDNLPVMLTGLLEGMTATYGTTKFLWLAYVVEGYCRPKVDEEDVETAVRGEMEQEYKTNPATDVREGIIATVYPWDGEALAQTVLYRYDDNGMPVFDDLDETELIGNAGGGAVPELFQTFIAHCRLVADAKNN